MRKLKRAWLVIRLEGTKKYLVLKRSETSNNPRHWGLVGGSSRKKIKPKKLIRKESLEEIGIDFGKLELFFEADILNSTFYYYHTVISKELVSQIKLNYEHSDYSFLEMEKLLKKKKLHLSLKIFISLIINEALK